MTLLAQESQEPQYGFGFDGSVNGRFRPIGVIGLPEVPTD